MSLEPPKKWEIFLFEGRSVLPRCLVTVVFFDRRDGVVTRCPRKKRNESFWQRLSKGKIFNDSYCFQVYIYDKWIIFQIARSTHLHYWTKTYDRLFEDKRILFCLILVPNKPNTTSSGTCTNDRFRVPFKNDQSQCRCVFQ